MKRYMIKKLAKIVCVFALCLFIFTIARAQNPIEDAVKQLTSDNAKGYLQPMVTSFGANLNSGMFHSADIGDMSFTLKLDFIGMGTLISDDEKKYSATPPFPFDQTPVKTATIFGDKGAVAYKLIGPDTLEYAFQSGQIKTRIAPLVLPQITIGDLYGTRAVIRYVPIPKIGDFPKITLFGIGVQHKVSRYIPTVPVDIAAGIAYQTLDIGDIFKAKALCLNAQASKSFSILTLYGGLQYETSSMDISYEFKGQYGAAPGTKMKLSMDGDNKFRFNAGLGLNLAILHIYGDINLGSVTVVSGGIGLGF
jgi:hypothetical protein